MLPAILAIDQGTTRTKALIFDAQAHCLAECSSDYSYLAIRVGVNGGLVAARLH